MIVEYLMKSGIMKENRENTVKNMGTIRIFKIANRIDKRISSIIILDSRVIPNFSENNSRETSVNWKTLGANTLLHKPTSNKGNTRRRSWIKETTTLVSRTASNRMNNVYPT